LKRAKVAVVGSSNVDMVVQLGRLPRPGETVAGGRFFEAGGGKGANQAIAAARLGAEVSFIGCVGDDQFGRRSIAGLNAEGIETTGCRIIGGQATGVALIYVGPDGENMIALAPGANEALTVQDIHAASAAIASADILVVQLEVPPAAVLASMQVARQAGRPTLLNPAPAPEESAVHELLQLADFVNPNATEAHRITGIEVDDDDSAKAAGEKLLSMGARNAIITLGSHGAYAVSDNLTGPIPAYPQRAIDATGAGDAFTGALAVALAGGLEIAEACRFACAAGALATTRAGAQPSMPRLDEVAELIARNEKE
jgi:ribokinase